MARLLWSLQVIQGLEWVRQHYESPAVVVMALGGESQYALDVAVRNLALSGVPVVVAAGNEDTDACSKSPARWVHACRSTLSTEICPVIWPLSTGTEARDRVHRSRAFTSSWADLRPVSHQGRFWSCSCHSIQSDEEACGVVLDLRSCLDAVIAFPAKQHICTFLSSVVSNTSVQGTSGNHNSGNNPGGCQALEFSRRGVKFRQVCGCLGAQLEYHGLTQV